MNLSLRHASMAVFAHHRHHSRWRTTVDSLLAHATSTASNQIFHTLQNFDACRRAAHGASWLTKGANFRHTRNSVSRTPWT